jgi:hypothetical protein
MKQAYMTVDPLHHLTGEFKNEAQNSVSRRMLRSEVI